MAGYLFLSLSLVAGAAKGGLGKITSKFATDAGMAMRISSIRMFFCVIIGLLAAVISGGAAFLKVDLPILLISLLSGIGTAAFVVFWLLSVRKSAYMMLDVFLTLGTLIPILLGSFLFDETIKVTQWAGFALLVAAVVIMCSYNNSIKERITLQSFLLLALCGISNGITDFSQKLFIKHHAEVPISVFNFYTYLFAFIVILLILAGMGRHKMEKDQETKKWIGYISLMAICLFANSYFKTAAAQYLDSVLLYPLNQGLALMISTGMSAVFFKERITAKCAAGIFLAFLALVIINVV